MKKVFLVSTLLLLLAGITGCSHEVGSEEWCLELKGKDSGEWTGNETKDYAKHCLFK